MSSTKFEVGEIIKGKSKALKSMLGTIQNIQIDRKKFKYEILFADNKIRVVSNRSIEKSNNFTSQDQNGQNEDDEMKSDTGEELYEEGYGSGGTEEDEEMDELNEAFIR